MAQNSIGTHIYGRFYHFEPFSFRGALTRLWRGPRAHASRAAHGLSGVSLRGNWVVVISTSMHRCILSVLLLAACTSHSQRRLAYGGMPAELQRLHDEGWLEALRRRGLPVEPSPLGSGLRTPWATWATTRALAGSWDRSTPGPPTGVSQWPSPVSKPWA